MSDRPTVNPRIRVHGDARRRLRRLRRDDTETYSDVLDRVLPTPSRYAQLADPREDMATIAVEEPIHERVTDLAGEGVPIWRVVDYYLLRYELDRRHEQYDAADALDIAFHRITLGPETDDE